MKLELYNTTERVKTVPKYRYTGKFVIPAKGSVDIEEYMTEFFAPYSKIGVVVRVKNIDETADKVKVEETVVEPKVEEVKVEKVEEIKSEKVEEPKVEEVVETELKEESVKEDDKYTREDLSEKTVRELRDIAAELKIDVSDIRRKDDIINAIVDVK